MRIRRLHVEGFRSLKNVTWTPGDLNVVIGPNGAGKSNLLRLLECIAVSAQGGLSKHIRSAGGIGALLWDGRAEHVSWGVKGGIVDQFADLAPNGIEYGAMLSPLGQNGGAFRVECEQAGGALCLHAGQVPSPASVLHRDASVDTASVISRSGDDTAVPGDDVPNEETLLSQMTSAVGTHAVVQSLRNGLASWGIHHDLRVDSSAPLRQSAVARMERRVDPDGQNLVNVLHTLYTSDRAFKEQINNAMSAAFGDEFDGLEFPPAADQRVQLRVQWKNLKRGHSAADLSDGMLRFLLLLTILASPDAAPLIAIDEPETGLHPSMLPIIAEFAVEAADRSQVIFTTHSPQFLDAFRDTAPTTTVALWEDGQTKLATLDGDVLKKWLAEYSLGTLFSSGDLENLA